MQRKLVPSLLLILVLAGACLVVQTGHAQISFSAGTYSQNFDSLANSGTTNAWIDNSTLPGWYASKTLGGTITTYRAGTGSDNAGAIYSYGTTASSERALGSIGSGTPGNFAYGVRFANDTTLAITNLTISYSGEQWRNGGNTTPQTLAFSYLVSSSAITSSDAPGINPWVTFAPLSFNSPTVGAAAAALDGNGGPNRQLFSDLLLPDVVVFPGQEIFFRWLDLNDAGNDHGLAIDDLTVTFTSVTPITNPPAISSSGQPQSRTNHAGTTATFTVAATGSALSYLWLKDDNGIIDGVKYAGSTTPTLSVSNVLAYDAADYTVLVSNGAGSVKSLPAVLTVIDPAVSTPPADRTSIIGDTANFFVSAAGTIPLHYQWRFNGEDIPGENANSLNVLNVQTTNEGAYSVAVRNVNGDSTTSAVVHLTLLTTPAIRVAEWDFNATNTLLTSAPESSIGTGTASLLNGITAAFGTGTFSDPAGAPGPANSGWNSAGYPPQGSSNKTAGVQFNLSTAGYQDVRLTWEERHSNTASKYVRLQYSTDGINFIDGPLMVMTATNNGYVFYTASLANIPGVDNNANFAFRFVPEWEASALGNNNSNYVGTVTSYSTGGTIRFDLVRLFANPLGTISPIPLVLQQSGSQATLTWANSAFSLEVAPSASGPWATLIGAASPWTIDLTESRRFFRLKSP